MWNFQIVLFVMFNQSPRTRRGIVPHIPCNSKQLYSLVVVTFLLYRPLTSTLLVGTLRKVNQSFVCEKYGRSTLTRKRIFEVRRKRVAFESLELEVGMSTSIRTIRKEWLLVLKNDCSRP